MKLCDQLEEERRDLENVSWKIWLCFEPCPLYAGVGWWKCRGPEISHSCGLTVSCLTCGKTGDGNRNTLKNTYKVSKELLTFWGIHRETFQVVNIKCSSICFNNVIHALLYDIDFLMFENEYFLFKKKYTREISVKQRPWYNVQMNP